MVPKFVGLLMLVACAALLLGIATEHSFGAGPSGPSTRQTASAQSPNGDASNQRGFFGGVIGPIEFILRWWGAVLDVGPRNAVGTAWLQTWLSGNTAYRVAFVLSAPITLILLGGVTAASKAQKKSQ